ncbi:MAG: hypothetical protein U9N55_01415 [candidate division Zixibacteria bacterium]|nr:hypothetical protein [candidate division Zixibacteria bacterium]
MRSRKFLLLLGTVVMIAVGMVIYGCSGDDTPTGTTGNPNNPEFLEVKGQVSTLVDSTLNWFNGGLGSIHHLQGDGTVNPIYYGPSDPETTTTDTSEYKNGWHVIHFAFTTSNYSMVQYDSIQFRRNGAYQQNASDLDALRLRHRWQYNAQDTTVTHCNYAGNTNFSFDNLDQEQCDVTGTCNWMANSKQVCADSTVWRGFDIDVDITGGKINKTPTGWSQGTLEEGTFSVTIEMTYQKDSDAPVTTNWNAVVAFNSGTNSTAVSCGDVTWTY